MKSCPKCGRPENEIAMTTTIEPSENNSARCPCGWEGKVGSLSTGSKVEKEGPPRSLGEIVSDIMPHLSEEAQIYLSENDAAWASGSVPSGIVIENQTDYTDPDKLNKAQIVEALKVLGVEFDASAKKDDLLAKYKAELAKNVPPTV